MKTLWEFNLNQGMVEVLTALAPSLISVVVFGVYMVIEKGLTPARAYTVLSLLNLLQFPLNNLVSGWN